MRHLIAAVALLSALACRPSTSSVVAPDAGAPGDPLERVDARDAKQLLAVVDQMADKLKDKPKTFEVLAALGNLYYENARYLDAVDTYRQALEKSAAAEAEAVALRKRGVKPSAELPLECRRSGPSYGLAQIAEVARKLEATDPARALRCQDEALGMAVAARARRGNALYLIGNPDQALAEHQRVLEREADHPESLFFVGAILLEKSRSDPALRERGKQMWRRLLEVAPEHPRAALVRENLPKVDELFALKKEPSRVPPGHPAVGQGAQEPGQLPAGHPPLTAGAQGAPSPAQPGPSAEQGGPTAEQVKNVAEAVANTERTPELEKSLDAAVARGEELLDEGKYQDARSALLPAMPMRPNDPRLAAALGGAMRGLGKLPMAERVLSRALELDPRSPRANYEMGLLLAAKGDKPAAAQRFQAAAADAAFAQKHKVADELARLK
jgi:tetratricopeptide (TPR) repeat protein